MWTTAMILEDQIDPQLGQLGLAAPTGSGWCEYLSTYSLHSSAPIVVGGAGGRHDDDLLALPFHANTPPELGASAKVPIL